MIDLVDPTIPPPAREQIIRAPRPRFLNGLRIGLIENTKRNSEAVLRKIGEKFEAAYGTESVILLHKQQRAALKDTQIEQLKGRTDFAIIGVGD